mmetsp:Transcript_2617/g.3491  ORF Transcript_2617/g.3491 Transcript_2617/m.3491 type:complete len:615 (+) Transcript_2617:122-1966(+)
MSQSSASKHLQRFLKSIPLSRLKQGSTLSIQSAVPLTRLEIQSQWRDDGLAELKQYLPEKSSFEHQLVEMSVSQQEDSDTSLGRMEPHFLISLQNASSLSSFPSTGQAETTDEPPLAPNPEKDSKFVDLEKNSGHGEDVEMGVFLSIQLPEKANLICNLMQGGSIHVKGKVEGDVQLSTSNGDIKVKKLRGYNIEIESKNGLVYVQDLIEAQNLSLDAGRIRAKQLRGTSIQLSVTNESSPSSLLGTSQQENIQILESDDEGSLVDVSSLYISGNGGATVKVQQQQEANAPSGLQRRAVRIKSSHGPVRVETKGLGQPHQVNQLSDNRDLYPLVELGGINGNCEVEILDSTPRDENSRVDWTSCSVHVDSLSPDSVSLVSADTGNIHLTLDRKVESDLRLLSLLPNSECLAESSALLAEEEDTEQIVNILRHLPSKPTEEATDGERRISIETKAFTARSGSDFDKILELRQSSVEYVDGWVDNKSAEPDSRFEVKLKNDAVSLQAGVGGIGGGGGGKIRVDSAAYQALDGFNKGSNDGDGDADGKQKSTSAPLDPSVRPLLAAVGMGKIKVETLSWVGAIARRYGLERDDHRGLGRQATRRGRSLISPDDDEFQ